MHILSRVYASAWGKALAGSIVGAGVLFAAAGPAQASSLTQAQIDAIVSLLNSFSVASTTISSVQSVLNGQSTSGLPGNGNASVQSITGAMIGFLHKGANGEGVCYLHAILATDPDVSISITSSDTGSNCPFGPLTEAALKNFQRKHGIEAVGFIGPKTLAALESELSSNPLAIENESSDNATSTDGHGHGRGNGHQVCAIVPPGHLIAPGWLRHHGDDQPVVPTCQTLPPGIIGQLGGGGGSSSTTTLMISGVSAAGISGTGATVNWTTTIPASSQVAYGTTTSYGSTTPLVSALSTSHSAVLSDLMPSTTYHFQAASAAGSQSATSSDMTFMTSAAADVTAPVISALSAGSITSSAAAISWTTDENATSKVYYATTTPINFASALSATFAGSMTSHSVMLTSLTASTTYYFAAVSADASGNTATSSTLSFTTQ